ncbi:MAG: hypothetical protein ACJ8D8_17770 [Microvirga sp.]
MSSAVAPHVNRRNTRSIFLASSFEEKGPRRFYRHFLADHGVREKWAGHDPEHIRLLRVGARLMARQVRQCLLLSADQRRSID